MFKFDYQPFFDWEGSDAIVNDSVDSVRVILKESVDQSGSDFGMIEHKIWLEVMPQDQDKFFDEAKVVVDGHTYYVNGRPVERICGLVEVQLGL